MSFGNVLTRLYDAFSPVLISIMTQLCDIFSFVLMHIFIGKKETNTIKNILCKTRPFLFIIYLFMFFTETEFSSSKYSFNCSLSLKERAVVWWNSKQHSHWKEALKGVPKKLNITLQTWNFVFGKPDINLNEWMNK